MNEDTVEEIMKLPEEQMLENAGQEGKIVQQDNYNAEDVAAAFFRLNAAKFDELLAQMAPYQLRNAIRNAVTYPFGKEYVPETPEEKTFAYLVSEMMLNRSIMQLAYEMQKAEQEYLAKQTEMNDNKTNEEVKDGQMES